MARRASSCPASSSYADPMILEAQTQRIDALETQNATVLAQMAQQSAQMEQQSAMMAAYREEMAETRRLNQELMKKMEEMYSTRSS